VRQSSSKNIETVQQVNKLNDENERAILREKKKVGSTQKAASRKRLEAEIAREKGRKKNKKGEIGKRCEWRGRGWDLGRERRVKGLRVAYVPSYTIVLSIKSCKFCKSDPWFIFYL
jgi:hypothetical protein